MLIKMWSEMETVETKMALCWTVVLNTFCKHSSHINRKSYNNLLKRYQRILLNCSAHSTAVTSDEVKIAIPNRIERGPTDILKALSSTIGKDFTAPHYKYHDDPFLIPASNFAKRTYALSRESGRKTAQYFKEKYPERFVTNAAEPNIEAFMPKINENSVDSLVMHIMDADVDEAVNIYKALKKEGEEISGEIMQSLLELLCYYNCEQPNNDDMIEERWYKQNVSAERRKTWKENDLAEKIFSDMENKTPEAYCAMIKGMAKFYAIDKAVTLFEEMKSKGLKVDVETYNMLIPMTIFIKEGSHNRWEHVLELLKQMCDENVNPNLNTMVAILELISKFGSFPNAKKYALQVMSEMKRLGIEPSLACYYYLLVIFCKERGPMSPILYDIMDQLDGKELTIKHVKDTSFFLMAMDVCHNHLHDKLMAYRVNKLLNTGNNYLLIGDSFRESIYFQNFFKLLCTSESIEKFFEIYHNLVPNTYTPEPAVIQEIIRAINLSGELHHLPQVWSDIVVFNHVNRDNIIEDLLAVLAQDQQPELLQKQFSEIAKDLFERISSQAPNQLRSVVQWTSSMLGNIINVHLNTDKFSDAWKIMVKCDQEQNKISGFLNQSTLERLVNECIRQSDADKAVICVKYAMEVGYEEAHDFASNIVEKLVLNDNQRITIESLVGSTS